MMLVSLVYKSGRRYQYGKMQIIQKGRRDNLSGSEHMCVCYCVMIKCDYFVKSPTVFKLINKLDTQ